MKLSIRVVVFAMALALGSTWAGAAARPGYPPAPPNGPGTAGGLQAFVSVR